MGITYKHELITPEQLALFIRAWNAFHEGRTLAQMVMVKNELSNANFPALKAPGQA